jgi:predicted GNAT family acetyltransferase
MDLHIEHEPGRFVARIAGAEAFITYERNGNVLDVQHTYTPPNLRGQDIGAQLTAAVFAYARTEGLKIIPTCPYTRAWVTRHPELRALVASY